jgi:hypothetical protein
MVPRPAHRLRPLRRVPENELWNGAPRRVARVIRKIPVAILDYWPLPAMIRMSHHGVTGSSDKSMLVRFAHKGRVIAVNPARVAFVQEDRDNPRFTYIWFSGQGDGSYAYVEATVEEVLAKLGQPEPANRTDAERELLHRIADYVVGLEECASRDLGQNSRTAALLRELLARCDAERQG